MWHAICDSDRSKKSLLRSDIARNDAYSGVDADAV